MFFLAKKRFDTVGAFATSNQAFSSFLTLIILILIFFSFYLNKWLMLFGLSTLFVVQVISEYKFLIFAKKYFGSKMLFFSLFGIQIINIGILMGVVYFFLNSINIFLKYIKNKF